jgi:spore maturation protein A
VFYPIIRFIFPQVPREHPANGAILMNMTTSILGLGNAATPFGLKAMKELQSLNPNPEVATDAQVTLLAYNTAGLALIPTTLLAVRKSAGCSDPFEIIGTCLVTGLVSTITAITMAKLLARLPFFSVRAALAESAAVSAVIEPIKTVPQAQVAAAVAGSEEERS